MAETKDQTTGPEPMNASRWGVRAVDTDFVRVNINGLLFDFDPRGAADLAQTIRTILGIEKPALESLLALAQRTTNAEQDALTAELAEARAAIERVRRLQELTIAASCRVQAIEQAHDTLAALNAPERPEDTREKSADRLAPHREVMIATVQEAAIYLDAWGAELTALQAGAVVDAVLDAVRKAEDTREGEPC